MRESCISHPARQPMAVVRQDYYLLMNRDCIAAALLNIFEYWANGAIAFNPNEENPWLGVKTTKDFENMLLGMATDKHIRKRLHQLEEMGFIETRQPVAHRKSLEFRFMVSVVQDALDKANGQTTAGSTESQRSNDRRANGQTTAGSTESQRSNDRCTIYKNDLIQERRKEEEAPTTLQSELPFAEVEQPQPQTPATLPTKVEIIHETEEPLCSSIVPARFDNPEQTNVTSALSQQEVEFLKQAQIYAFNPAIAPWRDGASLINLQVQKAVFDANPNWYSTGSGAVNTKKICDRIKSLERQMRGTGTQAIEAYTELMRYTSMAQIPNSAEILKKNSDDAKRNSVTSNLKSMLADRLAQKGVQI